MIDYYTFGMTVPNRNYSSPSYRYGFQGQEKDDEIKGNGNSLNYKYRMHDPRVGRFFAVDPLVGLHPEASPYAYVLNNPVFYTDPDGRFEVPIHIDITKQALKRSGFKGLNFAIIKGVRNADYFGFNKDLHFDNRNGFKSIKNQWDKINRQIDKIAKSSNIHQKYNGSGGLGSTLHNVQDFYSHSNYVELYVEYYEAKYGEKPSEVPIFDEGIKDKELTKYLKDNNFKTGSFDIKSYIIDEKIKGKDMEPDSHQQMNKDDAKGYYGKLAKETAIKHSTKILKKLKE